MKRQFMPLNTSQGQDGYPEQASSSDGWLTADAHANKASGWPAEGLPPPPHVTHPPAGTGLLAGWKSSQLSQAQAKDVGKPVPISMVEQDTIEQPIIQGPITGTALYHSFAQNLAAGPVSPHQSSINNSLPAMFTNSPAQTLQPWGSYPNTSPISPTPGLMPSSPSQPLQPFGTQPLPPMAGPYPSQLLQPFHPFAPAALPQQAQGQWANWPATGTGSQNGPPLWMQNTSHKLGKKMQRFPIWARVAVAMLTLLLILTGSGAAYYEANFAAPVSNIVNQKAPFLKGEDNPNQSRGSNDILSGGRINILLLGSDTDEKFQGGYLAQTDIVVTIDPSTKNVGMLSIPRDLYVNVPNYGAMKLDEAYFTGNRYDHNAVGLSRLTIYQNFGIPINYYAWVGLNGFIKVVNTAGGVDIDVIHPITDDVYPDDTGNSLNAYAYKRLYLAPGPQHLDGPTALDYVRSRHADLVGDFGRSTRQQQVLSQLKTRLINSDIITKLPELAQDMNGYLKTDMQILDVVKLMNFARTINSNNIQRVILSPPTYSYASIATSGQDKGADIFLPICAPIQKVVASMFALGNNAKCPHTQANNGNSHTSILATAAQRPSPSASYAPTLQAPGVPNTYWQTFRQMAGMSLNGNHDHNLFGIRSLLDLLLMIVFESPAGLRL